MRRPLLALVIAAFASVSLVPSASAGTGQATGAATKCKSKNKKKCKKKKTTKKKASTGLKDGDYTYKQGAAGSAPVNTLTISAKGTKVRIRELFFSSGESTSGMACAATMVDFGTLRLRREGDYLRWGDDGSKATVPPIQTDGAGGGTGTTHGHINVKTLDVYVATNVVMKNRNLRSGCLEGHTYEKPQKLKRK